MTSRCRFCSHELAIPFADLGLSPVSNHFRTASSVDKLGQTFYPLKAMVCGNCWLVQLTEVETPAHFTADYAYFSSHSSSWLEHAARYAEKMTAALALGGGSLVVELASNDGYLLQYFKQAGVPVLGIDPTENTARAAKENHGIETVVDFFGRELAGKLLSQGIAADLVCGNNVLAHVPHPGDFIAGVPLILKPEGTLTFEFPHLLRMIEQCQFDTIYHEHFSYLSLRVVETMLGAHGLEVYGVEELTTHGGSLRVFARHAGADVTDPVLEQGRDKVRRDEEVAGLGKAETYQAFAREIVTRKLDLLDFLIAAKRQGKRVLGYGAPAKGNTMLNYCGAGPELLEFTVDMSPQKQGTYLPGLNIPVREPEALLAQQPDYVLILPWNLRDEIAQQLAGVHEWGGRFVVAIPRLELF